MTIGGGRLTTGSARPARPPRRAVDHRIASAPSGSAVGSAGVGLLEASSALAVGAGTARSTAPVEGAPAPIEQSATIEHVE
jgi:hypothetical protein